MRDNRLLTIANVILGVIVIIPIIGSILKSGVDCDSAYYICIAERISEGYVLYSDLHAGYTPIWFYIMTAFKMIFNIPNGLYWPYLCLLFAFEILTAISLYKMMRRWEVKHIVAYGCACLFLLTTHWLFGNAVLLEFPFMFWGLLSCWLIFEWRGKANWWYIFVGLFSCLSFLSKQYGAGFLILDLFALFFMAKRSWKAAECYLTGYIIPIIACLIIWGDNFISCVFNGYGTASAVEAGYDVSLWAKLSNMCWAFRFYLIMVCPFTAVSILFLPSAYKQGRLLNFVFAYCGIFGFLLQFYFSYSEHYFLPLVPFGIILIAETLTLKNGKYLTYLKYIALLFTIALVLYKTYYNRVYKRYIMDNERGAQENMTKIVLSKINRNGRIFIPHGGLFYIYFTANVLPPNMSTIGYSFGPMGLNIKDCVKQVNDADYVLHFTKELMLELYGGDDYEYYYSDSIQQYVDQFPSDTLDAINGGMGTIVLHYSKCLIP